MSGESTQPKVAFGRYNDYHNLFCRYADILRDIGGMVDKVAALEISAHVIGLDATESTLWSDKTLMQAMTFESLPKSTHASILAAYAEIKKHGFIKEMAKVSKQIIQIKPELAGKDLSVFVGRAHVQPLSPFCKMELGKWGGACSPTPLHGSPMGTSAPDAPTKGAALCDALLKLCECTKQTVNLYMSPDIDFDDLSVDIRDVLAKAQKAVPGCKDAFKELMSSVDLMKTNFSDYFRAFTITKQPSVILEKYANDVEKLTGSDPSTKPQYIKIVQFLRKSIASNAKDSRITKMLDMAMNEYSRNDPCADDEKAAPTEAVMPPPAADAVPAPTPEK